MYNHKLRCHGAFLHCQFPFPLTLLHNFERRYAQRLRSRSFRIVQRRKSGGKKNGKHSRKHKRITIQNHKIDVIDKTTTANSEVKQKMIQKMKKKAHARIKDNNERTKKSIFCAENVCNVESNPFRFSMRSPLSFAISLL